MSINNLKIALHSINQDKILPIDLKSAKKNISPFWNSLCSLCTAAVSQGNSNSPSSK